MRAVKLYLISVIVFAMAFHAQATNSTINTINRWAWCEGSGWLNCRVDSTNGAVIGEFVCSGYFYSEGSGWIHLGDGSPTNGFEYSNSSTNDYGVNHDGKGHLTGYAWNESAEWINFEWTNKEHADAPKVDLETGNLSGYAWGGPLGWISLTNISVYVKTDTIDQGPDDDNDGIPDMWEISQTGSTNTIGGSSTNDADDDGVFDCDEYIAGTDPTNENDYLQLTAISVTGGANIQLTWASEESRVYKVEWREDLINGAGWTNLGLYSPDPGSNTIEIIPAGTETQGFYRIQAALPLSE